MTAERIQNEGGSESRYDVEGPASIVLGGIKQLFNRFQEYRVARSSHLPVLELTPEVEEKQPAGPLTLAGRALHAAGAEVKHELYDGYGRTADLVGHARSEELDLDRLVGLTD